MLVGLICRRAHPFCQLHPGERALHGAGACLALDQLLEAEHPALQSHLPGIPVPLVVLLPVAIVSALLACAHRLNGLCFARWGLIAHHVVAWPVGVSGRARRSGLDGVRFSGRASAGRYSPENRVTKYMCMHMHMYMYVVLVRRKFLTVGLRSDARSAAALLLLRAVCVALAAVCWAAHV